MESRPTRQRVSTLGLTDMCQTSVFNLVTLSTQQQQQQSWQRQRQQVASIKIYKYMNITSVHTYTYTYKYICMCASWMTESMNGAACNFNCIRTRAARTAKSSFNSCVPPPTTTTTTRVAATAQSHSGNYNLHLCNKLRITLIAHCGKLRQDSSLFLSDFFKPTNRRHLHHS